MSKGSLPKTGTNVAATAFSPWPNAAGNVAAQLQIGDNSLISPGDPATPVFWLVVVDLTDLSIAANDVSTDGATVPSDVAQYAGNSGYFLYAISTNAWASIMPTGNLYTLLQKVGSGSKMARLEQIYAQIGTGYLANFSYILAATMSEDDEPGFETFSMDHLTLLTMAFMPVEVGGQTIYAPIQLG